MKINHLPKRSLLIALMGLGIGTAHLQAQKINIEFKEFDLKNGLHVIMHRDASTPIVDVAVMYKVGAKNEREDRTGFAHFFEHLMFEGTENIGRGEYGKIVEKAGGTLNANTTNDRTYYYQILPSNQLELGLWLESERMLHAKVDTIGVKTQQKVVIEEKKQSYDNRPYGTLFQEIFKRAFTVHPYRWTTIGNPEHIMNAKIDEFQEFYKTFYVPQNAVLVIAGDIEYEKTKMLVEKYYNDIPRGEKEIFRPSVVEPPLKAEVRDTIYDKVQLPLVAQAYRIPAIGTDDYYALDMLNVLLSNGNSSRLNKALVEDKQIAVNAGSFSYGLYEPGLVITYALPNFGIDSKDLEAEMNAEIKKVQDELIPENEFQKLKNQVENDFVQANVVISSRTSNLADYYTIYKNTDLINTELDKYLAVSREDIQRVAQKYLVADNRVVLYYLPISQKKIVSAEISLTTN